MTEQVSRRHVEEAIRKGLDVLERTQRPNGAWTGDYGGPIFLLPMYVATTYALGRLPDQDTTEGILRYFRNHQNPDGGWGLHVESHSHVFTTVLSYVAMRLLGVSADDPALTRARDWYRRHEGPLGSASWGKFMLAVLNLYDYEGLDPLPPELWILPESLPIHPSRMWCHARMVYLPMSFLYGIRARIPEDPLILRLRRELYDMPYEDVDWRRARSLVAEPDSYTPRSALYRASLPFLRSLEATGGRLLRSRALDRILDLIRHEDESTSYYCIGPVNKLLNTLVWHFVDPKGPELARHIEVLPEYLWHAEDGIKMNGYNSTELWDTAFAVQASFAAGAPATHRDMLQRAHDFIEANQVLEDVREHEKYYRHPSKGGWPFSNRAHGWPISDCTAEGLKAALLLRDLDPAKIAPERLVWAAELLLGYQNEDGGWATYERTRGPKWLERLNPSDVFADIMIDYSYPECTSSCLQALARFRPEAPEDMQSRIGTALERGRKFLLETQRPDGSWEGSWGICFTYGTWFGVWGLRAAGLPPDHPAIQRACDFLEAHQMADGGWGEHAESCRRREYVHTEEGQAVMTSWALLALLAGGRRDSRAVARGVSFLVRRQRPDGTWPAEHIAGMFNKTSAIHYDNYLKIFPVWALALWLR